MRKLAPAVLMTSMLALAGSAFANTADKTTDKSTKTDTITGSPTVDSNKPTNADLSYSDKSNTSPGTNAKMDKANKKKVKAKAKTDVTMDTTTTKPSADLPATSSAPVASPAPMASPAPTTAPIGNTATQAAKTNETTGLSPQ